MFASNAARKARNGWDAVRNARPGIPWSRPRSPELPASKVAVRGEPARKLSRIELKNTDRTPLPLNELNRVLGGGLVAGSVALISGEPGIGKSTLLLQVADMISTVRGNAVYVSAEETEHQIKLRAQRLGITGENLYLLSETDLDVVINELDNLNPGFVVIDSIQTVGLPEVAAAPGQYHPDPGMHSASNAVG